MNLTPGGLLGYASSKCMTRRKVPSSKGVSAGPIMTAFLYLCQYESSKGVLKVSVSSLHDKKI
jgi:hypothetical protein